MGRLGGLAALALLLLPAACRGADGEGRPPAGGELHGPLLVSAAASLTDAFAEVADTFEALHPRVDVRLNLAGSATLRAQILEGAPMDVFAPADEATMEAVAGAGALAGEPRVFARNRLVLAVPAGNPASVEGLGDFAREELLLGLCAETVPCGALAREALARAGVEPAVDTREPDVRALLTKVELGELDAGLVYATDAGAAGDAVRALPLPPEAQVSARYPVAVLAGSPNPAAARAFRDFVLSDGGRAILARHGFGPP